MRRNQNTPGTKARLRLVSETIRRFNHLGTMTISRHLLLNYPEHFETIEQARGSVYGVMKRENLKPSSPVPLPKTWAKPRTEHFLSAGTWGYMSDVHIPYHEPKPVEAAVQWFQAQGVTGLLLNGDILDFAGVGFWPGLKRDFDREIEASIDFLDFLRTELPNVEIVFKPGNHEYRLPRYFVSRAPELATTPLAAMEHIMGFEARNIQFLQWKQKVRAGGLHIVHGDELPIQTAVNPARGLFLKGRVSAMCGHFHRSSEHTERNLDGNLISTWSIGCMCDLSPDYAPYGNWNWGTAIVHVTKPDATVGGFEVEARRILPSGKIR